MVIRGEVHWADLGDASGSAPARRRPVLVVQADPFNHSRLATTIVAVLTTNTALSAVPGNVFLPAAVTGLPKDSVLNVTGIVTLDQKVLDPHPVGKIPDHLMADIDEGLRLVLGLGG